MLRVRRTDNVRRYYVRRDKVGFFNDLDHMSLTELNEYK